MSPEWHGTLFGILIDSSLRVSLVAAIVALILIIMRVRSSSVRHAAWTAVLCAMLLMPVLPYCVPSFTIPLRFTVPDPVAIPSASTEVVPPSIETSALPADMENHDRPTPVVTSAIAPVRAADTLPARAPIWPSAVLIVYLAGLLALLSHLFLGWRVMSRIVRTSQEIDPGRGSLVELAGSCGASRVRICESQLVAAPLTAGVAFPRIVLPASWTLWPEGKIRAVLAHELAHVERRDSLVGLLARLNRCIFWFHPLAWWLERKLASMAEHACDDAAVRVVGETRRYAEILLDMAEAVRRNGRRFSWQGVGVSGSGLLGQRIDRILRGDLFPEMSRIRKAVVALSCAAAIFIVVACRRQTPPAPLQVNPSGMIGQEAQSKAEDVLQKQVRDLDAQGAADLEASLNKNPEDLAARRILLRFYAQRGSQLLGAEKARAARRRHILWLIEHHPEIELTGSWEAQIGSSDAVGMEQARKLWLAQTSRADASAASLGNAAGFFERTDPPTAEKLLLQAQTLDPKGLWTLRLGKLYASVLLRAGPAKPARTNPPDTNQLYAQQIRNKLAESKDARLLAEVGARLAGMLVLRGQPLIVSDALERVQIQARSISFALGNRVQSTLDPLGKSYLEQALKMDPQSMQAHSVFVRGRVLERNAQMRQALRDVPGELTYAAVSTLPERDRFSSLTQLAETAYLDGERIDYYRHDTTSAVVARAAWDLARKYAEDELSLAPKFRNDPDYGTAIFEANIVLGTVALRQGDKKSAVRYMLEASRAPASEELAYSTWPSLTPKLLGYLLKYGERDTVIEFLERYAQINVVQQASLLEAADQIRKGIQPAWYPRENASQAPGR